MQFVRISFFARRITGKTTGNIYCRIRLNGTEEDMPLGIKVLLEKWDAKRYLIKDDSQQSKAENIFIEGVRTRLNVLFNEISRGPNADKLTAQYLRAVYEGKAEKKVTLLELLQQVVDDKKEMHKNGLLSKGTLSQYQRLLINSSEFIKDVFKTKDIVLEKTGHKGSPEYMIGDEFVRWMRKESYKESTIYKDLSILKVCFSQAVIKGYINSDPLVRVEMKKPGDAPYKYLTLEELESFKNVATTTHHESLVKSVFLLCCYTGLSYADIVRLTDDHIHKGIEGFDWIFIGRQKTLRSSKITCKIPLSNEAIEMITGIKKENTYNRDTIVPHITNNALDYTLGILRLRAKIYDKKITMHVARHTFTIMMLDKGFTFDAVAAMLGHASSDITRKVYGEIRPTRIAMEANKLQMPDFFVKQN